MRRSIILGDVIFIIVGIAMMKIGQIVVDKAIAKYGYTLLSGISISIVIAGGLCFLAGLYIVLDLACYHITGKYLVTYIASELRR